MISVHKKHDPEDYYPQLEFTRNRRYKIRKRLNQVLSLKQEKSVTLEELGLHKNGIGRLKVLLNNYGKEIVVCVEHQDF